MSRPAIDTRRDQEGFIIIEVLVSAIILALVAGAVLTLITATTRGAASQRAHSVAYGLAQEAQAKLRTKRVSELTSYSKTEETPPIGGTKYTIATQAVFVSNTTQAVSCGENDEPDYIRLTSTVSAPGMVTPVTIRSVVSPTNGSLEPNVGSLQIQAWNAAHEPLSGVEFELIGATGTVPRHVMSESTGCASVGDIPSGKYTLKSSAPGLVNTKGEKSTEEKPEVSTSTTFRANVSYDKPGTLQPTFVFLNAASGKKEPATVDSMQVFNSASGLGPKTVESVGGKRVPTLKAESLYPFKNSKYTVYAGSCEKDNPDPTGTKTANDTAMGFTEVPPGGEAPSPQIQLPALNLTVTYGKTKAAVQGAEVALTDTKCNKKRVYVTNTGGHLAAATTGLTEGGLPWSTYKVCVKAFVEGKNRRYETPSNEPVVVENLTTGTPLEVNLEKAEESTKAC